jgi:hypothetical protein
MMVPPFYYHGYDAPPKLLKAGVAREGKRRRGRAAAMRCPACLCNLSSMICRNMMCKLYLQEMRYPHAKT